MPRAFKIGDVVRIKRLTKARNQYGQVIKSGDLVDAHSKGRVVSYNDKYTDTQSDDILKLVIISGDPELKGKKIWIKSCDFEKLNKVY